MTLSVSNQASCRFKLEGTYPTNFGQLQGGNGTIFNFTGESFAYDLVNIKSKTIRSDRSVQDIAQVDANATGGFKCEQIWKDIDWFLQGALQSQFTFYGTNGVASVGSTFTVTSTSVLTISSALSGADNLTNLKCGMFFSIKPNVAAPAALIAYLAKAVFRVHPTTAPTSTVITLDPATLWNVTLSGVAVAGTFTNAKVSTGYCYNGTAMQTFSVEVAHLDITEFRQYFGYAVDSVEITFASGAIVEIDVQFKGQSMQLLGTTAMGTPLAAQTFTPANATKGVMGVMEGGTMISVVTFVKSGKIKMTNNLRSQEAVGVFGAAGIAAGTFEVTGSLEMYFADATHYNKALNGTLSALAIPVVDAQGNGYTYSIPAMKYLAAKVAATAENTDNMLSMEFQAILDQVATNDTVGKSFALYRH